MHYVEQQTTTISSLIAQVFTRVCRTFSIAKQIAKFSSFLFMIRWQFLGKKRFYTILSISRVPIAFLCLYYIEIDEHTKKITLQIVCRGRLLSIVNWNLFTAHKKRQITIVDFAFIFFPLCFLPSIRFLVRFQFKFKKTDRMSDNRMKYMYIWIYVTKWKYRHPISNI